MFAVSTTFRATLIKSLAKGVFEVQKDRHKEAQRETDIRTDQQRDRQSDIRSRRDRLNDI